MAGITKEYDERAKNLIDAFFRDDMGKLATAFKQLSLSDLELLRKDLDTMLRMTISEIADRPDK